MKFLIDRAELPYDAMVSDASWLIPIDDKDDSGREMTMDKGTANHRAVEDA